MKTYLAIAIVGCCCLATVAFAKKPESANNLADLLPIGTCVLRHYDTGKYGIEIVDKKAKVEDLDKAIVSLSPTSSTIYEVTNVASDHVLLKPKGTDGDNWEAMPYSSITAIFNRGKPDAK